MQDRNEEVQSWLLAATEDYECAREINPRHRGAIGFHLQQAAEKLLKALLVSAEIEPPRTHDLTVLWTMLCSQGILEEPTSEISDALVVLRRLHWLGQYPIGSSPPSANILEKEITEGFLLVEHLQKRTKHTLERISKDQETTIQLSRI